ncbi:MAG: phage tail protein, partial [Clostridia bacterium]|nr:phage tail protein [Clostridia bacterium]
MILLSGHSLTPARKVPVEALSLTLKERDSTASMTPADMEGITTESWFLDDKEPGAGIVWRVRSIGTAYATHTPTVQLEHAISTLKDKILFGETKPENISGGSTCTARQAVEYILRQQGDWVLGQFDYSVTNAYKFDGDSLFDCLEAVTDTLDDPWWSYDMSRYPFRLNITRRSSGVESELRCGRNLRTITRTIDRSGMYTRFYPIGKDDLHLAGTPYVERNANLYGIIEHTETDTSRETDGELRSWANEKLARHAEPVVNIEVEGLELVESTGEALDRLRLGRMCRVPLPEFGTTITERIVSLTYQDTIHQPEVVRITLANNRDDVTRIIAENMKSGGRGGRGAARQAKEDHAWFEDTNDHVAMVAEGIVGVDAEGNPNWTLLSEIIVDGTGIHQNVTEVQNGLTLAETHIEQNSRAITLEAQRASAAEGTLSGRITVAADAITQEVTRATTAEGTLSGRITVTADAINQEVTRATSAEGTLSGRITVEANRITQ